MPSTSTQYRRPARLLHWTMAILILAMIPAGVVMVQPGIDRALQNTLFIFHKNVGVLLIFFIIVRAAYRLIYPPAPLPDDLPGWQHRIAGLSHGLLYGLLFVIPVAGYVRVKAGGFPIETLDWLGVPSLVPRSDTLAQIAKSVHYFSGLAIAALIVMHVGAALYHGVIRRDGVFSRMWPPFAGRGS